MQAGRTVKSDTLLRHLPQPQQTTHKKQPRNIVEVQLTTQPLSPRLTHHQISHPQPYVPQHQPNNLSTEQIRIKGQEKLLYVRQCRQAQASHSQIFAGYPFSQVGGWTPNDCALRDSQGKICGQTVEDEEGVHLVQDVIDNNRGGKILNGAALSLLKNGAIFEGIYHDSHYCGLGYEIQPCGNTYIGQFRDGNKHGKGSYYWFCTKEIYSGDWQSGLPHGYGTYQAQDKYEGTFANGLKFGHGVQTFSNGDRYVGEYVNGVSEGYGQYSWADGSIYKGDFKHGARHGYGIWFDQKEQYRGHYRMDQKEGMGVYTWIGRQVYRGEFKQDFRDGYGELSQLLQNQQKLSFKGCWMKGRKKEDGKIDRSAAKRLYLFLDERQKYQQLLGEKAFRRKTGSKAKSKSRSIGRERVGHRNCIPPEQLHQPNYSPGRK